MFKKTIMALTFLVITSTTSFSKEIEKGKVLDIKNSGGYIYLQVKTDKETLWAAVPGAEVKIGDIVSIDAQMRTEQYTSKALDITFKNVIFGVLEDNNSKKYKRISKEEFIKAHKKEAVTYDKDGIKIAIKKLINQKKNFNKKLVEVTGKVVKISKNIMNTNWVHLSDKDGNILVIRTAEDRLYKGQDVKAKGIILLDVDYGYNYKYEIILVDTVFKES